MVFLQTFDFLKVLNYFLIFFNYFNGVLLKIKKIILNCYIIFKK